MARFQNTSGLIRPALFLSGNRIARRPLAAMGTGILREDALNFGSEYFRSHQLSLNVVVFECELRKPPPPIKEAAAKTFNT